MYHMNITQYILISCCLLGNDMSMMHHCEVLYGLAYEVAPFFVWPVPKKCLIFVPTLYAFCMLCGMMGSTVAQNYNNSMD